VRTFERNVRPELQADRRQRDSAPLPGYCKPNSEARPRSQDASGCILIAGQGGRDSGGLSGLSGQHPKAPRKKTDSFLVAFQAPLFKGRLAQTSAEMDSTPKAATA